MQRKLLRPNGRGGLDLIGVNVAVSDDEILVCNYGVHKQKECAPSNELMSYATT